MKNRMHIVRIMVCLSYSITIFSLPTILPAKRIKLFTSSRAFNFKLGLENITVPLIQKYGLAKQRVGLVTNQTGCDQQGTPALDILRKKGVNITVIFVPEHGYTGTVPAGISVHDSTETHTAIPMVSLYSQSKGLVGRTINSEQLNQVDLILFDMQDCGMRHYTYISTLMRCLEAAAMHKKPIFVLDRPNLLGAHIEGPLVDADLISFISIAPIPLRYGMTIGELALYFNTHILANPAQLKVVPMKGYNRQSITTLPKQLSPNIQTIQACYGYSFLGLLGEISPFDVGVGTSHAFRCIMLSRSKNIPKATWNKVKSILSHYNVKSSDFSMFSERKKEYFDGLCIHIDDINAVHSFDLFLELVKFFRIQGVALAYAATFDKSVGVHAIRQMLEAKVERATIKKSYNNELCYFYKKAFPLFLYTPHPHLVD